MDLKDDESGLSFEILNALPDGVIWVTPVFETTNGENKLIDFEVKYSNVTANKLIDVADELMAGKKIIADLLPNSVSSLSVFEQYKQVFESGEQQEYRFFNTHLNLFLNVVRKKFKDGVLTITRDTTTQEDRERELSTQKNFVQSMLNASLHGVILLKPTYSDEGIIEDFILLAANSATKEHWGIAPNDARGQLMSSIAVRYKEAGFFNTYVTALKTGQVQRRELYYQDERTNGWFDLGVAPIEDSVVVTFANITENKNAQRLVEEAAAYLQAVIDISQTGIFVFTPVFNDSNELIDFRFRIANRTLAGYVGQTPETVEGALGSTWFPAYKTNGLFDLYSDTFVSGKTNRFDFHYNDDNINVWLDIMATKFGDEVLVTFSDYTNLKKLQQQLEDSVKELKRSNDRLKEFAYVASHDLQEPLRKITTFGNILEQRHKDTLGDDGRRLIERMQSATKRMQVLINDLLNYSQMNTRAVNLQEVDLNEVIQGILADLDETITANNAVIHIEKLPMLQADPGQLRQLFQNLISNAIKFKKDNVNPEIFITTKKITGAEADAQLHVNDPAREFNLITVKDNGIGFQQQYAQQIFHIFQRLHGRSEYPGTGIGLAIVQKAAENHRGFIYAESELGMGASFHVMLPA